MAKTQKQNFSLADMSEQTGVARRTIRYYIARGLLPGPLRVGRGAAYDERHLERLREIQRLKTTGYSLAEIGRLTESDPSAAPTPEPTRWCRYELADDVVLLARDDVSPWRTREVRNLVRDATRRLRRAEPHDRPQA